MNEPITRLVLISTPPLLLRSRLEDLREELCRKGSCREALRYPVHLTLRTGVLLPDSKREDFLESFGAHVRTLVPFRVELGALITERMPEGSGQGAGGCFAGFEVAMTEELINAHNALAAFAPYRKGLQYPYRPHLTMAFDDLSAEGLEAIRRAAAGKENDFVGQAWTCRAVECYRRDGERWILDSSVPLGGATEAS